MAFFKRLFGSEAALDPKATYALVDSTYEKLAGEPFSLGSQLITQKLLANEPAAYSLSNSRQAVRLGVLRYFALLTAGSQAEGLGAIITKYDTAKEYENDRYGKSGISARDFLWAFHIDLLGSEPIRRMMPTGYTGIWDNKPKGLIIVHLDNFKIVHNVLQRRATFPIIEDDDKTLKIIPSSTMRDLQYKPFK